MKKELIILMLSILIFIHSSYSYEQASVLSISNPIISLGKCEGLLNDRIGLPDKKYICRLDIDWDLYKENINNCTILIRKIEVPNPVEVISRYPLKDFLGRLMIDNSIYNLNIPVFIEDVGDYKINFELKCIVNGMEPSGSRSKRVNILEPYNYDQYKLMFDQKETQDKQNRNMVIISLMSLSIAVLSLIHNKEQKNKVRIEYIDPKILEKLKGKKK